MIIEVTKDGNTSLMASYRHSHGCEVFTLIVKLHKWIKLVLHFNLRY